ncbi:MAG: hydroxysqualene dehydroxylase HpnE [Betaproteobacteria bacterium]
MEDLARGVSPPVAVIGGGWAGCAAALTLADAGVPVALHEAGAVLGGRARRVERDGLPLDNGQHLLLGAYAQTLALLDRVHGAVDARSRVVRLPLTLVPFASSQSNALTLIARAAPGRLGLLLGLLLARGLPWRERVANIRWFAALERTGFKRPAHETVATMLRALPPRVSIQLWEPLCVAALNTPAATASAQVFANVLRAAFAGTPHASDFVLAAQDLSALFPDAAQRAIVAAGGSVMLGRRAQVISARAGQAMLAVGDRAVPAAAIIVAVGPHQVTQALAPEFVAAQPALAAAVDVLQLLHYESITTVWLGYAERAELSAAIMRLDDAPGQWLVDRPDVLTRATVAAARPPLAQMLAAIISTDGPHLQLPHAELARTIDAQLRRLRPDWPRCVWSQVIVEKRATYACTPDRLRPAAPRLSPGLYLAGDYVDAEFPATLEAAVRSGITAAQAVLDDRK